jgi:phytoene dehydrogenase-like protein
LYDAILIGAGHHNLVAAGYLARAGWKVAIFEREQRAGGCLLTAPVTLPGFHHDLMPSFVHLLFLSPAYREFRREWERLGLTLRRAALPAASLFPDGDSVLLCDRLPATLASIGRHSKSDAESCRRLYLTYRQVREGLAGILGSPPPSVATAWRALRIRALLGPRGTAEFLRLALLSPRHLAGERFEHPRVRAWLIHLAARLGGAGPDTPGSALAALLYLGMAMDSAAGLAIPEGGMAVLAGVMADHLRSLGGEIHLGREVTRVVVRRRTARGVQLGDGTIVEARRAVIAGVSPTRLFLQMVGPEHLPPAFLSLASRYRYGLSLFRIELALSARPQWSGGESCQSAALLHIAPSIVDLARAHHEATHHHLPAAPGVAVGQPTVLDPRRAPPGKHILWITANPVPYAIQGDAAGAIAGRSWDQVKEAYADRVIGLLRPYCPELEGLIEARHVLSPVDLERLNPNLVRGDPAAGSFEPDQAFIFRPLAGWSRYSTPIRRLYLCGASTHPGPGVTGASGYALARMLRG